MTSPLQTQDKGLDFRLTASEVDRIKNLLTKRLDGVTDGSIADYTESRETEIEDINWLLDKLSTGW